MPSTKAGNSKREAAKRRAEEAQELLAAEVEKLNDPDEWAAFLAFAARFHSYSYGNVLLIMAQRPDATQVAGFRKWQELGRQVRKGEKGLTILAPRQGPCWGCTSDGERRAAKASHRPVRGSGCDRCSGSGRFLYFTTATVFDVSQTDGEPLPARPGPSADLLEGGDDGLFDSLAERLVPEGWTLTVGDAGGGGVNGYCDHAGRRIVVEGDREPAHRVKTLVHEVAHAHLHAPDVVDYTANRGRCEVEAESVAHVVLAGLGLDTSRYSLGYVSGWANGEAEVLRASAGRVVRLAHDLLDRLVEEDAEQGAAAVPVAA